MGKCCYENRELRFPEKKEIQVGDCGVERQLFATQVFFFCRFIGLERKILAWQWVVRVGEVLFVWLRQTDVAISYPAFADGRAEVVAETGEKFRRQRIILLVMAKPQKRKITVGKTGKTIRGCRDKHQGNLFERDGARKVSHVGEAPRDSTGECVPFVLSGFAYIFGHGACRSA
ncbi:hypothetical protein [Bacteroides fragilis]|jgi:hypothetical protein|uniref:hypothetical protein n=1 Tax=Bacteroides fragilis TaxID=817 RepID=UPI000516CB87|nr:hypothetical protein [Bacteroides fragilis]MCE8971854.1 hypothetical protein [Bacteroides fragilis]